MKNTIVIIILIFFVFTGCANNINTTTSSDLEANSTIASSEMNQSNSPTKQSVVTATKEDEGTSQPNFVNLNVPFVSQAPLRVWDDLHNEACEEAAVIGVVLYLENSNMNSNEKDLEIKKLVSWQEKNFGGHFDLPLEKVQELVKSFYHRQVEIITDTSVDSIKKELIKGNPVIIPAAGRVLGNPYFKNPGPVYHMLVIRGYDDEKGEFITNDVGTNTKGENFRYKYNKLIDTIHDMPAWQQNKTTLDANPEMIFSGKKVMMIIR